MANAHPARLAANERGWSQIELARRVGISPEVLRHILAGRRPSWPKLRREIAELLEIDERELFPEVRHDQVPA